MADAPMAPALTDERRAPTTLPWVTPQMAVDRAWPAALNALGVTDRERDRHLYTITACIPMAVGDEPLYRITLAVWRRAWCGRQHTAGAAVVYVAARSGAVAGWERI